MAIFRKIHVQFWADVFIQSLTPEQKFFFLYLLTNDRTKQCGIYEVTTRQISYDTGYNVETINKLISFFEAQKKILYSRETNEMAIKNWDKYNGNTSPKVKNLVNKELKHVKNHKLIQYLYSMDTVSIDYQTRSRVEEEPEKNQNKKKKKEDTVLPRMTEKEFKEYSQKLKADKIFIEPIFQQGVKPEHLERWILRYHIQIVGDDKLNKDYIEYRKHFKNWLNLQDYCNPPPALTSIESAKQMGSPIRKESETDFDKYDI